MRESNTRELDNLLNFLFQMVGLYKDPKGEAIFERTSTHSTIPGLSSNELDERDNEMNTLRRRIKELEDEVKKKEVSNYFNH